MVASFEKFCKEAIKVKVPGNRVPFELFDAQRESVRDFMQYRQNVALKARQLGFSTLVAAFALWCALGGVDRQIYLLSKKKDASISLLNKAKFAWKTMPDWARRRAPGNIDKNMLKMSFDNDSFIMSSPTGSDPIRGETAWLVVLDEWAHFPDQEAAWDSVEPVANVGGRVVGLSTANGEGDLFHKFYVEAEAGTNLFHPIFHPWWARDGRDEQWYDGQKKNMLPWQLHQNYPNNPEEAFIGSGNPYFDLEILRQKTPKEPIRTFGIKNMPNNSWLQDDTKDTVRVWEDPIPHKSYVMGVDVAQGLDYGDYSVIYVMNAETGNMAAQYRGKDEPDVLAEIAAGLGYKYHYALICPEVNSVGSVTVTYLRKLKYERIYMRRAKLKRGEAATATYGWYTSHGNKHDLIGDLAVWLRDHNVPDQATLTELKQFRRIQVGKRVSLEGSPHDDCVMALALTVEARKYAIANNIASTSPSDVKGSIDYYVKQLDRERSGRNKRRMRPIM